MGNHPEHDAATSGTAQGADAQGKSPESGRDAGTGQGPGKTPDPRGPDGGVPLRDGGDAGMQREVGDFESDDADGSLPGRMGGGLAGG